MSAGLLSAAKDSWKVRAAKVESRSASSGLPGRTVTPGAAAPVLREAPELPELPVRRTLSVTSVRPPPGLSSANESPIAARCRWLAAAGNATLGARFPRHGLQRRVRPQRTFCV